MMMNRFSRVLLRHTRTHVHAWRSCSSATSSATDAAAATAEDYAKEAKESMDAAIEAAGGDEAAAIAATTNENVTVADVSPSDLAIHPPAGAEREYSPKLEEIATEISKLNLLEVSDLVELLQQKLGLPDMSMMAMGAGGGGGAVAAGEGAEEEEAAVEKTEFDLKLEKFDAKGKIKLIKACRAAMDLGLKEAKALVESAPVVLKKSLTKDEAEELKKSLEELGAECVLE